MKVSIVIPVLNSHKVVIRQARHFKKMNLPRDVEIIIMDDGSNPPLEFNTGVRNFSIHKTGEKRAWTQGLAKNKGAKLAKGEYLFFTDIDHILTQEAIEGVRKFKGDMMIFRRFLGIFDRRGNVLCDTKTLLAFGANPKYRHRGWSGGVHSNTCAIKKKVFDELGGYKDEYCSTKFHVGGLFMSEERDLNRRFQRGVNAGKYQAAAIGAKIYVYPIGKFHRTGEENPGGLFHTLSREQVPQPDKD